MDKGIRVGEVNKEDVRAEDIIEIIATGKMSKV